MSKSSEVCDKFGYPIHPGDILKTYHFTGARRKKYYLYHMVIEEAGRLFLASMQYKSGKPEFVRMCTLTGAGWYNEDTGRLEQTEIVQGFGPGELIDYEARPKRKKVASC